MGVRLPPFAPHALRAFDVLAVAGLALVVRLAWLVLPRPMLGDSADYWRVGINIASFGVFSFDGATPTSFWPPLYPATIALLSRFSAHPPEALTALQLAAAAATASLTAAVGASAFSRRAGLLAGGVFALAPMSSRYAGLILTETLFMFWLMLAIWCWVRDFGIAAGVALGLATLTRTTALPFVLLVGGIGIVARDPRTRGTCLRMAAVALLTLAPWVARNVAVLGRVTIADASWGSNLAFGTVPLHFGENRYAQVARELGFEDVAPHGPPPGEAGAIRLAVGRMTAHPARWLYARLSQYPWLLLDSGDYLPIAANSVSFDDAWRLRRLTPLALKAAFVVGNVVFATLAARGAWRHRRRAWELLPVWLWPAYFLLANVPMFVEPRYGLALVPFLAVLAAAP